MSVWAMRVVHSGECERAFGSLLPQCTAGPLCRFKSCPSEPANSSCSIFIKPLSLKEPYPDHGKSHSSCSHSHALSILALIPLLPALLCLSHSLSSFLSPPHPLFTSPVDLSLPPSLSLFPSLPLTHTLRHTLSLSPTHIYINTRAYTTHMLRHTHAHSIHQSPAYLCRLGGSGAGGGFRQRCLWGCFAIIWERSGSQLFSLSSSSHSWNAKTGLMDISELCLPDPLSYHNQ